MTKMNKQMRPRRKHFPLKPKKGRTIFTRVHLTKETDEMLKYLWGHFRISLDDIVDEAVRSKYTMIQQGEEGQSAPESHQDA